jgi:hypothetical protein
MAAAPGALRPAWREEADMACALMRGTPLTSLFNASEKAPSVRDWADGLAQRASVRRSSLPAAAAGDEERQVQVVFMRRAIDLGTAHKTQDRNDGCLTPRIVARNAKSDNVCLEAATIDYNSMQRDIDKSVVRL